LEQLANEGGIRQRLRKGDSAEVFLDEGRRVSSYNCLLEADSFTFFDNGYQISWDDFSFRYGMVIAGNKLSCQ
jgi:hypothetical protein